MKSNRTSAFLTCLAALPRDVQEQAWRSYRLWQSNHSHPSLRFKPVRGHDGLYSVRVGRGWRALGRVDGDTITWFWIGSHADYDGLIG